MTSTYYLWLEPKFIASSSLDWATTYRYANGSSVQGMEVTQLNQDVSLELVYTSSKITSRSDSAEDEAAAKIVEQLDHVPQAVAYIKL